MKEARCQKNRSGTDDFHNISGIENMIIGLDVGGTHTDVVLLGPGGLRNRVKVLTDTTDLFSTVLAGLDRITRDIDPNEITQTVLSTTLTTNAIVENKLSPVGMIVTCGPGIHPDNYRTGIHYYMVKGGIDHSGREIQAIDEDQVRDAAQKMVDDGIAHVGVVGKFSTRSPDHENKICKLIEPDFEKVFPGHRISGNFSFPRRIATTFLNASIYPIHKKFFEAVKASLVAKGINAPIYILKADGGTMDFNTSIDFPGQSILSGPAASVMGSVAFAEDPSETIVLDIGGTTTDMAVLINRVPVLVPAGIEINSFKTHIRALHTRSVGLGGDSAVRVQSGELIIGPDRIGPAMAYGGPSPTPTDALFVLAQANDGDRDNAQRGIAAIAEQLGVSTEEAARRVFDKTCRLILEKADEMVRKINSKPVYTVREALEGYQIKPGHLLVLGGPAPHFARHFQEIAGYKVNTVPQWDVANAIGTALSRTTCEVTLFVDTYRCRAMAPEENYQAPVNPRITLAEAHEIALELLTQKALREGALPGEFETDVLESLEFNMIRNFQLIGRNIRIKIQVRPGLKHEHHEIAHMINNTPETGN